jgi:hypothetical protein
MTREQITFRRLSDALAGGNAATSEGDIPDPPEHRSEHPSSVAGAKTEFRSYASMVTNSCLVNCDATFTTAAVQ